MKQILPFADATMSSQRKAAEVLTATSSHFAIIAASGGTGPNPELHSYVHT